MLQSEIIAALEKLKQADVDRGDFESAGFPQHFIDTAVRIGVQDIAADFALPPSTHLLVENLRFGTRTTGWLIFALTASNDMWLIQRDGADDQIAFLPEDEAAGASPQPLGIGLLQWYELALYVREHEAALGRARSESEKRSLKQKAKKFLETLSPGLLQRYPYSL